MKTVIETEGYPVRIVLVPETDEDRKAMEVLKFHFTEDEDSSREFEYEDGDDVAEFGAGVLTITAWCNLT